MMNNFDLVLFNFSHFFFFHVIKLIMIYKKLIGESNDFNVLIRHLDKDFQTAFKKVIEYKRVSTIDDKNKNTFYIHSGEPTKVVTYVNGEKETENSCNPGDFVITGSKGEKYVIAPHKLPNNYNLIDNLLVTRQQPRTVVKVSAQVLKSLKLPKQITFTASWGEQVILQAGDYIVKEDKDKFYRIEGTIFKQTYTFTKPI